MLQFKGFFNLICLFALQVWKTFDRLHIKRINNQHNAPINSKVQHLNFWRLYCSNSLPSGQKSRSNAPPISTELPLLKDKFLLQSNTKLHAFQREICCNDTFKLLLKTPWKSYSLTNAKFYLVNPSHPAKTEKSHKRITSEEEINPVQIPHPSNARFKFPPTRARCKVKCPGMPGGGMLKFRIDRRITTTYFYRYSNHIDFALWASHNTGLILLLW